MAKKPIPLPVHLCRFCNWHESKTAQEFIQRLKSCNNCRADSLMSGQWTGAGVAGLKWAKRTFGLRKLRIAFIEKEGTSRPQETER